MRGFSRRPCGVLNTIGVILLCLWCVSCIVVPVGMFTESPYRPEVLHSLKNADRGLIRRIFGKPQLVKAAGQYWFYFNSRETWGIIGGTSSAVIAEHEWLAVQFDETGRVVFIESAETKKCLSNGMCLDGSAPNAQDAAIKSYRAGPDECALYLFLEPLPWPLVTGVAKFRVNGKVIGGVNSGTYLFLTVPPGQVKVEAYDLAISTHCDDGEALYVRAVKKRDLSWETGKDLAPVTGEEGKRSVAARRLALPD